MIGPNRYMIPTDTEPTQAEETKFAPIRDPPGDRMKIRTIWMSTHEVAIHTISCSTSVVPFVVLCAMQFGAVLYSVMLCCVEFQYVVILLRFSLCDYSPPYEE